MTKQTVTFQGKTYVEAPFVGMPQGAISVPIMMGPELLELYNLVSSNLGRGRVKRFADNKSGARRTWTILTEWAAQDDSIESVRIDNAQRLSGKSAGAVVLDDVDQRQIADEAASRKPQPRSEELIAVVVAAGARAQAQAALRNNPPSSGNAAKDAEMPALRKAARPLSLAPKSKVYPRRHGSKQAILVDLLSRPQGATFGELYDALAASGKPWKGVTIRSGLAWDINNIAGYGVSSELLNGEQFAEQGREYEARRLGLLPSRIETFNGEGRVTQWEHGDGYDPDLKLAVYRLTYPVGMDAPLLHTGKKA